MEWNKVQLTPSEMQSLLATAMEFSPSLVPLLVSRFLPHLDTIALQGLCFAAMPDCFQWFTALWEAKPDFTAGWPAYPVEELCRHAVLSLHGGAPLSASRHEASIGLLGGGNGKPTQDTTGKAVILYCAGG